MEPTIMLPSTPAISLETTDTPAINPASDPSPDDLRAVRRILANFDLPAELIFQIIHEADYYPAVRGTLPDELHALYGRYRIGASMLYSALMVDASVDCPTGENHVARLCMLTPPLPDGAPGEVFRAKGIVWDLRGCLGHGSQDLAAHQPAEMMSCQYQACIIRPSAEYPAGQPSPMAGAGATDDADLESRLHTLFKDDPEHSSSVFDRNYCAPEDIQATLAALGYTLVTHGTGDAISAVWHVQNTPVTWAPQDCRVVWGASRAFNDDADPEELQQEDGASGSGEGFLDALRPGDIVGLWMRAQNLGSKNVLTSASVKMTYNVY
ncbi:hypothetical protein C8Q77DRAFT_1154339 [Trametes polyzona]|nr:hypothetical protein C8Q77DRAFT_1154339 [Trametes polyzona]